MRHASLARLFAACAFGWLGAGWPTSARTLNEILDRAAFTICAAPDALPSSSRDAPEPGFLIELAQMIARQLGVRLDTDWIEFTRTARSVNCDAIMAVADDRPTADVNPAQAGSRAVSADGDASRPKIRRIAVGVARDAARRSGRWTTCERSRSPRRLTAMPTTSWTPPACTCGPSFKPNPRFLMRSPPVKSPPVRCRIGILVGIAKPTRVRCCTRKTD